MATYNQLNPPPLRKITDFKSKLSGGGARSNLFEVVLSFPDIAPADVTVLDKSRFLVKSAALPGSAITPLDVAFRGRTLKVAGDRTFESWTVTIINDTDFSIRSAFENWMNKIPINAKNNFWVRFIQEICKDFIQINTIFKYDER